MDDRTPGVLTRGKLCCQCLAVETSSGIVLVDTGFGLRDVANPRTRLSKFFLTLLSPDFREKMTALRQLQRLGISAADVRHIRGAAEDLAGPPALPAAAVGHARQLARLRRTGQTAI